MAHQWGWRWREVANGWCQLKATSSWCWKMLRQHWMRQARGCISKASMPFTWTNYKPELDNTPKLDPSHAMYFQGLIGILRWCIKLIRVDIIKRWWSCPAFWLVQEKATWNKPFTSWLTLRSIYVHHWYLMIQSLIFLAFILRNAIGKCNIWEWKNWSRMMHPNHWDAEWQQHAT